jgi:pullulanase
MLAPSPLDGKSIQVGEASLSLPADFLDRKRTDFVLWHANSPSAAAASTPAAPVLVIGEFQPGNPPSLANAKRFLLLPVPGFTDLFSIPAADCALNDGWVYHYWFETEDSDHRRDPPQRVQCTDPAASTVDWRLLAPRLPAPFTADDRQPAAVIKYRGGQLIACDPAGEEGDFGGEPSPDTLPANNQLVIYEMPTAWSNISEPDDLDIGVGTFRDVLALIDPNEQGANFDNLSVTQLGRSYLPDLGINALELLPPADSFFKREWGYDTAHYLAPDAELGFPEGFSSSTANMDLTALVRTGHQKGIRFFLDVVMAFAREEAYQTLNLDDFYIINPGADPSDPDSHTSRSPNELRNGFGSTLFRYARFVSGYDPISGTQTSIVPARQLMYTFITRWMRDFHIDGIRMDSVENVSNWDFVEGFKDRARQLFQERCAAQGVSAADADERFLVVGEELSLPMALLTQGRLDGLWNDMFRALVRSVILGEGDIASFENNVRQMVDCRALGFTDGAQAVNYITSHDVEGFRRERLYNFLRNAGLGAGDIEKRIELAFVCLLTAVGIPMILAGEEFADEHSRFDKNGSVTQAGGKQVDPVNYARLEGTDPATQMRQRILAYVSKLVQLRTTHPALGVNDTNFFHVDFNAGKRVLVWQRGDATTDPVVVLANFSDFVTTDPSNPSSEYLVPNWPATPPGRSWREVTQNRPVPLNWIGREPIYAWEAKVYTLA